MSSGEAAVLAQSIINEIQMAKRLSRASKHVVHMYDFDFHRNTGLAFLVMELGEQDLEKLFKERGRLASAERKEIWRQLVSIAITLHSNNIVISPSLRLNRFGDIVIALFVGTFGHQTTEYCDVSGWPSETS